MVEGSKIMTTEHIAAILDVLIISGWLWLGFQWNKRA
jgi:hypothetical protein